MDMSDDELKGQLKQVTRHLKDISTVQQGQAVAIGKMEERLGFIEESQRRLDNNVTLAVNQVREHTSHIHALEQRCQDHRDYADADKKRTEERFKKVSTELRNVGALVDKAHKDGLLEETTTRTQLVKQETKLTTLWAVIAVIAGSLAVGTGLVFSILSYFKG